MPEGPQSVSGDTARDFGALADRAADLRRRIETHLAALGLPSSPGVAEATGPLARESRLRRDISASARELSVLRHELIAWLREAEVAEDQILDIALATYEAAANVADHAYTGRPGVLEFHAAAGQDAITVTIRDHGSWRTPPAAAGNRGRGLKMIRTLAGRADIIATAAGTTVSMRWSRAG